MNNFKRSLLHYHWAKANLQIPDLEKEKHITKENKVKIKTHFYHQFEVDLSLQILLIKRYAKSSLDLRLSLNDLLFQMKTLKSQKSQVIISLNGYMIRLALMPTLLTFHLLFQLLSRRSHSQTLWSSSRWLLTALLRLLARSPIC